MYTFFACLHVYVRVSDPLEMELHTKTDVNCHVGICVLNLGPLEDRAVLLSTEPSLQHPHFYFLTNSNKMFKYNGS